MPPFSCTSLDRLIEPSNSSSSSQVPSADRSTSFSFYPPLYATPSHQRPPSPTAFSPSPYVLNFKRRPPVLPQQNGEKSSNCGPSAQPHFQQQLYQLDGTQGNGAVAVSADAGRNEVTSLGDKGALRKKDHDALTESDVFEMELEKRETSPCRDRGLDKDKATVRDDTSTASHHGAQLTDAKSSRSLFSNEDAEFFDAADSAFSVSTSEDEVYSTIARPAKFLEERTGTNLEDEMVMRIKAEERVALWQRRWKEMAKRCATIGVSIPFEVDEDQIQNAEVTSQEFLVSKLVGEAIARAVVRAEKDEQLEQVIGNKNREISRLWDKLQYLELVNREMSQRNQEVIEITQRRKRRRQRRQKLALAGFCAVFCVGSAGLLSYKYIPWDQTKAWADSFLKSPAVKSNPA